jgi:hypothetical protein
MEISDIKKYIEEAFEKMLDTWKKEGDNLNKTKEISLKFMETKSLSKEDETFLKLQLVDHLKILGIVVPFVLIPGASLIMPILIKVAKTKNIDLLPSIMNSNETK